MKASNVVRGMVLAAAASALTACATNGGYTAYNGSHDGPKTIAILQPMNLESYTLLNQGGAGKMFGAIGALAEGPSDMAKMKQLDGSLKSVGFDFSTTFSQTLKSKLEAEGYNQVQIGCHQLYSCLCILSRLLRNTWSRASLDYESVIAITETTCEAAFDANDRVGGHLGRPAFVIRLLCFGDLPIDA